MSEQLFVPKRFLVDQDNVIANFDGGFLANWRQVHPDKPFVPLNHRRTFYIRDDYPEEFRADVEAIYTAPGFIRNLPPIPEAIKALKEMQAEGYIIRICSSTLTQYQNCVEEKYAWVERYLGPEWVRNLILAKDKTEIRGDILIDDKPEQTGDLVPTWEYVLFDQPYNRGVDSGRRLASWANWRELLN